MSGLFTLAELQPYLQPFVQLSYPTERPKNPDSFHDSNYYTTGWKDLCMIITCIAVMAILRDAFRLGFFEPLAKWKLHRDLRLRKAKQVASQQEKHKANGNGHSNGHTNGLANGKANGHSSNGDASSLQATPKELKQVHRSVLRFAEQGWSFVYYPAQWCFGLYVHYNLPTRVFDPTDLWIGYPHIPLAAPLKFYYLLQTAFYLHQILILNAEARRKDHVQMMTHHVITVFLMVTSYSYNWTRVGCLIMLLMDWCDIFLPLAKMIRYLDISQLLCDATFGVFLVSWLITRHFMFMSVILSLFRDCPRYVAFEWIPEEGHYMTSEVFWVFASALIALQILQMIWFGMICRVAWRVLTTKEGASDDRSDEEVDDNKEN